MSQICGILNLSPDSFSEAPSADPIALGEKLLADGADWLDIGAEASNVASAQVPSEVEIARLAPVVRHFSQHRVSIDTHKPEVFSAMAGLGASMWNDIQALRTQAARDVAAKTGAYVVLMFQRTPSEAAAMPEILRFFDSRIEEVLASGVRRDRIILDPGMGMFLGATPGPSVEVLGRLPELRRYGLPIYICPSRKSFLGALTGRQKPLERSAATLAAELFALQQGADYVRTHDVRALRDARIVWAAAAESAKLK
jgi:dihydropteroate synthase type 2